MLLLEKTCINMIIFFSKFFRNHFQINVKIKKKHPLAELDFVCSYMYNTQPRLLANLNTRTMTGDGYVKSHNGAQHEKSDRIYFFQTILMALNTQEYGTL
jgi:hypothetical protein